MDAIAARAGWSWYSDLGVDGTLPGAPASPLDGELVLLLAWLHHVASGLARAERFALGGRWLATNVVPVLESVAMVEDLGWDRTRDGASADVG